MSQVLVSFRKDSESKICYSYFILRLILYRIDQNVVRLNVSVDNFLPL